ncbi:MAG: hypothetical protein HFJ72_05725 [Adlercreutzia sp.]|uniref:hypothetical protein n=1 Tax=uncultured Adlercreutzia sp. TaxID=875803 RepID=UPI00216C1920|nr:hypothetical protein [uncultured Adlercreutzia sp.]MCI8425144.1 hypothetical protein [Adlercreutzia sp.]
MKKTKIFAALACAFALCLALAGCAGGTNGGGDNAANFQGDWVLSGGTSDGQELTAESISAMEEMGLYVYLQLNEGGNAVVSLFGTNVEGTWEAKDATTASLTLEGDTEDVVLQDGELVLAVDGNSLKFKKGAIPAEATEVQRDENQAAEPEA